MRCFGRGQVRRWACDKRTRAGLTVSTRLYRGFDVADAFDGDAVLVVAVNELVLELANLIDQHAQLVGHVGDVLVTGFTPDG